MTVIEIDASRAARRRARPGHAPVDAAPRGDARAPERARRDHGRVGRLAPPGDGARGGDGIPVRIAAWARTASADAGGARPRGGHRPQRVAHRADRRRCRARRRGGWRCSPCATRSALSRPRSPRWAWPRRSRSTRAPRRPRRRCGAPGLLVAGALAERALTLPGDGQIEADALVGWLPGLGALAGVALAAAALVLLAGTASGRDDRRRPGGGRGAGRRAARRAGPPPQRPDGRG